MSALNLERILCGNPILLMDGAAERVDFIG
jgi:hypothetical protein